MIDLATFVVGTAAALAIAWSAGVLSAACVGLRQRRRPWPVTIIERSTLIAALAIGVFSLLAAWTAFRLEVVVPLLVGAAALTRWRSAGVVRRAAAARRTYIRRVSRLLTRTPHSRRVLVVALGIFVLSIRTLLMPPLGWDTLTYHGVKEALWVQSGGALPLDMPGGWSIYRSYFAAAEVMRAWAMLPYHGDFLALWVDVSEWLLMALVVWRLARELRIKEPYASMTAGFALSVKTTTHLVGRGYVELLLTAAVSAALLFAVRFVRRRDGPDVLLAGMAIGLAASTKTPALLPAGLFLAALAGATLRLVPDRRAALWWAAGACATLAACAPWLLFNMRLTGYPLSPLPLVVAGVRLGASNPAMTWYMDHAFTGSMLQQELITLGQVFSPADLTESLGVQMLPLFVLVPFALVGERRRQPWATLIVAAVLFGAVAAYYSSGFTVVRRLTPATSSRFLLPSIAPAAVMLTAAAWRSRWKAWLWNYYRWTMAINATLIGLFLYAATGPLAATLSLTAAIAAVALATTAIRKQRVSLVLVVILAVAATGLWAWHQRTRYAGVAQSTMRLKYWLDSAGAVDTPGHPHVIAVTNGPLQTVDDQSLYYFFGRALQNQLIYVSPAADGRVHDFGRTLGEYPDASEDAWWRRLAESRADYVLSLWPASIELRWMEARPDRARRVFGESGDWGLFALRP